MGLIKRQKIYDVRRRAKTDTPIEEQKPQDCMPYCNDCVEAKEYDNSHRGSTADCIGCNSTDTILIYHRFKNEVGTDGLCDTYECWEYKCRTCIKYFEISEYGNYRKFYTR